MVAVPARAAVAPANATAEERGRRSIELPQITAKAVFVADVTAGVELWSRSADEPLPPASTTKIVTALVARRSLDPEERVTIAPEDLVDPAVFSNAGLLPGDRLTVRDLLAAMLVASAGDAARALARTAGQRLAPPGVDPVAAFVEAMNQEAGRLGLVRSRFATPDGRDTSGQVATARELAIAAAELLADPLLAELVATARYAIAIEGPNARTVFLDNTNQLLGLPGVIGVKTGTSPVAGQCLVLAVRRGNDTLLVVLLGSVDRYGDARALLAWLDGRYRWVTLDSRSFPELAGLAGQGLVPAIVPTVLVPAEAVDWVGLVIQPPDAAQQRSGTVRLRFGTTDLAVVPLIRVGHDRQGR
ncbi:MAG: serine hydrolase [Thermomicrobium sp.]|nr:serine hydrolase [Thermomicrobium sp.]